MAINFPSNPSNGDTHAGFTYNSTVGAWESTASNPVTQATLDGYLQVANSSSGTTVYSAISDLPLSGNESGAQAYVSGTNRLYLWTGSGWYNIALINTQPSLSGASASYTLNTDGSNTVVTLTSTDPEGIPITFTASHSGLGVGANAIATVTQSNNIFTFTPTTNTSLAGTFTSTFTASDGVNLAVANSSFTLSFTVNNSNYTTALITSVGTNNQVNNTFVDSSTNSHTITASGDATQTTFSPYRSGGYSTYFDGSGDYIRYQDASLAEGTDDFTVEFWVRRDGTQSLNDTIVGHDTTPGWQICFNSDGSTIRFMKDATDASRVLPASLNNQQWHHVVYQRDSGTLQGFLDGVSLGTSSTGTNFTNDNIEIGVNRGGTAYFTGNVRDVRIIKGTAFYSSSGFNVPTEPLTAVSGTGYSTTLLSCHLPYIADGGANSLSPTVNGNTKTEPVSPYDYGIYASGAYGGSMYFDGTGDYLSITNDTSLTIGTGDFTAEAWIYVESGASLNNYWRSFFALQGDGNAQAGSISLYMDDGGDGYPAGSPAAIFNGNSYRLQSSADVRGRWTHVALARESGTMRFFVNGALASSASDSTNYNATNPTLIGLSYASQSNYWLGHVADARFVKGTAVYTSAFTPPTAPLTAITNTQLLVSGTNAGIIDKSQTVQTLTLNGNVKSSTTQTKYLSSSMYFDGTDDYITVPAGNNLTNLGTDDFTVESWLYPNNTSWMIPWDFRSASDTDHIALFWSYTTGKYTFYENTSFRIAGSGTFSANEWHHVAVTRASGTCTLWVNGTSQGTATVNTNQNGDNLLWLGRYYLSNAYDYNGYISDFRITKGLARYTSSFTPPTAALTG